MREGLLDICGRILAEDAYQNAPAHLNPIQVIEQWHTLIKAPHKIEQSLSFEAMVGQVRMAAERLMEVHHIFGGTELPLSHNVLAQRLIGEFLMLYSDGAFHLRWNADRDNMWTVYHQLRGQAEQGTAEIGKGATLDDAVETVISHRKGASDEGN